uniref:Uncharacterized protein n=1 Tax=Lygus hesperus TaxID=30085 RepID=A0A146KL81_LYGHE
MGHGYHNTSRVVLCDRRIELHRGWNSNSRVDVYCDKHASNQCRLLYTDAVSTVQHCCRHPSETHAARGAYPVVDCNPPPHPPTVLLSLLHRPGSAVLVTGSTAYNTPHYPPWWQYCKHTSTQHGCVGCVVSYLHRIPTDECDLVHIRPHPVALASVPAESGYGVLRNGRCWRISE